MEKSHGNSLCRYLYLKLAKLSCFSFLSFLFYKIREQEGGLVLPRWGGLAPAEGGRWQGKGIGKGIGTKYVHTCMYMQK
jgi:hypothetical protein